MKSVVILQPQFFPWHGVFSQVANAGQYVHLDDVQMPRGRSFMNRVQVKTRTGTRWLTAPVKRSHCSEIREVRLQEDVKWRKQHLALLHHELSRAPHKELALDLAAEVYERADSYLAEMNIAAIQRISSVLGLKTSFFRSSALPSTSEGKGQAKLLGILQTLQADTYISGLGGLNYLDHGEFEDHGIEVRYMNYQLRAYPQLHEPFTPFVTILDLVANVGNDAGHHLCSNTIPWRDLANE